MKENAKINNYEGNTNFKRPQQNIMFSLVFFALVALAGLLFWMYFMWKTRALRQQLRERMDEQVRAGAFEPPVSEPVAGGEVIEGEAVRVVDERNRVAE